MPAYNHPMTRLSNPYSHMGWSLSDIGIKDPWETIRTEYIDPALTSVASTVGLSQAEIDKLKAEAGSAASAELQKQITQIIQGQQPAPAPAPSTAAQVQTQITSGIKNIMAQIQAGNPAYLAGAALAGGLVLYGLYSVVSGPKAA